MLQGLLGNVGRRPGTCPEGSLRSELSSSSAAVDSHYSLVVLDHGCVMTPKRNRCEIQAIPLGVKKERAILSLT